MGGGGGGEGLGTRLHTVNLATKTETHDSGNNTAVTRIYQHASLTPTRQQFDYYKRREIIRGTLLCV